MFKRVPESLKIFSKFGASSLVEILVGVLRAKFIAIFLGSSGIGFLGLIQSVISWFTVLTNMGQTVLSVNAISSEPGLENKYFKIRLVIKQFFILAFLGSISFLIFSHFLFDLLDLTVGGWLTHVILSFTIYFSVLKEGFSTVLQGTREHNSLIKSSIISNILGVFIMSFLVRFFGLDSIVPSIFITSFLSFFLIYFYFGKIGINTGKISLRKALNELKNNYVNGSLITISSLLSLSSLLLLRAYISYYGGLSELGLYTAGFSILTTYVGIVFSSMAMDYFPRLASAKHSYKDLNIVLNQQLEFIFSILPILLVLLIYFSNTILALLYTNDFLEIQNMIVISSVGIFFRGASWSLGYLLLVEDDKKKLLYQELISSCYMLLINIVFYHYWGLLGLGLSYAFGYIIHFFQLYYFTSCHYKIQITVRLKKFFITLFLHVIISVVFFIYRDKLNLFIYNVIFVLIGFSVLLVSFFQNKNILLDDN